MDGAKFSKLGKDSKLVGRGLSPTDVDLIFMKAKARGERRITFDQVHSGKSRVQHCCKGCC